MSDWERAHLVDACAFELAHCAFGHVRERVISCFNEIDHGLAEAVAGQLGMDVPAATRPNHGNSSPALSLANSPRESIATRKIAVLATDGVDLAGLSDLCARLEAEGALFDVIGVHEGNLSHAGGGSAMVDHGLFAVSAALYDGVLVPAGAEALAGLHDARRFVEHCYRHGKVVAAVGNGADLLERALAPRVRTSTGELIDDHSVITAGGADEQFTAAVRSALAAHRDFTRAAL
jgi:catalase